MPSENGRRKISVTAEVASDRVITTFPQVGFPSTSIATFPQVGLPSTSVITIPQAWFDPFHINGYISTGRLASTFRKQMASTIPVFTLSKNKDGCHTFVMYYMYSAHVFLFLP